MIFRSRVVPTLLTFLLVLVFPAAASAETYVVDSTADEADAAVGVAGCLTAGAKCTLRAAIQESNASTGVKDTVDFTAAFDGQLADTIALTLGELQITDEVTIDGDNGTPCPTQALIAGPCVGVSGSAGLDVLSDDVEIKGLAITEALIGIAVLNASSGFTATNNWLGVKLDGEAGANNTGVFIDPDSDFASIGGITSADRNVFAYNNNEGLDVEGASDAVIRGNFFGVEPDGTTAAANGKDIEITSSTAGGGFPATDNEVGRELTPEAAATPSCDGGCNVIANALSYGVDLSGSGPNEGPASGPTVIHGNHIGLDFGGTTARANAQYGVLVGNADLVTIGGALPEDGNHICGGIIGVLAGTSAADLVVSHNLIGVNGAGGSLGPPSEGVNVSSEGLASLAEEAVISQNTIKGTGTGITQHSHGATISGNDIQAAGIGIYTYGSVGARGNLIEGNSIVESNLQGILVENDDNTIAGNEVIASGEAGIRIQRFFTLGISSNVVGGDTASDENLISESDGDAIEIESFEETNNEVARNRGSENEDLFIDLISTEPGSEPEGPNEGIDPPAFATALQSSATGTAQPGATVRVFRKASAEPGELQSFLGEAVADGSGSWKVSYGSIPTGTIIAATQTNANGGTSQLETTPASADPSSGGGGGAGGGNNGGGGGGGGAVDTTPPKVTITKAPKAKSTSTTARFKFKANEAGSKFQCKLDKGKFKGCKSPKTYKKLKPGKHVFKVRAIDKAGNVGKPAKRKFTITS